MNQPYPLFFDNHLWAAQINKTDTFKVALLSSAYTFSAAHEFLSSLTGILATATLSGVTVVNGVFDAANTATSESGTAVAALVIYKDTGVAATSPIFMFFDTGINFAVDPSGAVTIVWPGDTTIGIFPTGGKA